jgi:hypothetical protein
MQYPSINNQGNIISGELIDKIREQDYKYQNTESFGFAKNINIRDEISNAWAVLRRQWETFKVKIEKLDKDESGIKETRQYWVNHLLNELGYDFEIRQKSQEDGLPFINSICRTPEEFPIHVEGIQQSIDKKPLKGGASAHGRLQEYLNKTDVHLYGLVTNGKYLRLLRDASRLVKLTYLEFNLEKMMEEELYADFAIMYRILHASRMPRLKGEGAESFIEYYHQESLAAGTRIREKLSEAVEKSIKGLGNGFIQHPDNIDLRTRLESGEIKPEEYYKYLLRLIYRILFLSVIEERHLIYKEGLHADEQKLREIYYHYYSLERHRKLADNHLFIDKFKQDLWSSLLANFRLFENEYYGAKLGIKPLAGDLFSENGLGMLSGCNLGNHAFMEMMLWLNFFEDEKKNKVRVNYGDLDVEEFGSVYEGLLDYDPVIKKENEQLVFDFKEGDARARSGAHYTPEELVKPLIKHSLDYIIADCISKPNERLKIKKEEVAKEQKKVLQEKALLAITVCDIACGSGHILLSAARRIAFELAQVRTGDEQPDPVTTRHATRDVIRHCIYGVDLNPLAVELCKVALWLEAHNPGEPLNFLDHRIKCGNSIVGLAHKEELENGIASEAFKTLPNDNKEIATAFRNKNIGERKSIGQTQLNFDEKVILPLENLQKAFHEFSKLPENTPNEIIEKQKAYIKLTSGTNWWRLKNLADLQVAQFFIPKTEANKDRLVTDAQYREYIRGTRVLQDIAVSKATAESSQRRFFHYFLEFPEIFANGGFDCILGNPPFLGGQKLTSIFGDNYLECIKYLYSPIGAVDLVTYFFRRNYNLIREKGFQSLISTNTISQGRAREDGLDVIVKNGGTINHAVRSIKWPGIAAVDVALVTITKQPWKGKFILASNEVCTITPYLDAAETIGNPYHLKQNENMSFQGSIVLGKGFILTPEKALALIKKDINNKKVLFPYLTGDDINNNPDHSPSRWVINFFDWEEEDAKKYPECYAIIEELVKPERELVNREIRRKYWWRFAERADKLYRSIIAAERVLVINRHTKYIQAAFQPKDIIYSEATVVLIIRGWTDFALFSSNLHSEWAWKNSATMGASTLRYSPSDCFETFPFPQNLIINNKEKLVQFGELYYNHRKQLMLRMHLGLTDIYNLYHFKNVLSECRVKSGRVLFPKYLEQKDNTISIGESIIDIIKLRELQVELDNATLEAYGWDDLINDNYRKIQNANGEESGKLHDFYEVDYLPENDRIRFTIHPDARKEILKRLLELNHMIFEEEARKGLHKEETVREFFKQKGKEMPHEIIQKIKEVEKQKKLDVKKSDKKNKGMEDQGEIF